MSIDNQPAFTGDQAFAALGDAYGIEARSLRLLPGERDQNFFVAAADGQAYVLKICNRDEEADFLLAQYQAMQLVGGQLPHQPAPLPTRDGAAIATVTVDGQEHTIRAVRYIDGVPLADLPRPSGHLLRQLGDHLGHFALAFQGFDHPVLHREFDWNLMQATDVVRSTRMLIPASDATAAQFIDVVLPRTEKALATFGSQLRQAAIHNDANDYNVIVSPTRDEFGERSIAGIIDFGDMAWSYQIAELAVALAYVVCRRTDWLSAACEVIRGYHNVWPLEDVELHCLFDLMLLRLCLSIGMSARQQQQRPDDEYLSISQQPIRNAIPKLQGICPRLVEYRFRDACGLCAHPRVGQVTSWIAARRDKFAPVMGVAISASNADVVDLSAESGAVAGTGGKAFPAIPGTYSIGRYNEPRLIYSSERYARDCSADGHQRRTIHLGIDIGAHAGHDVYAPLDGEVVCCTYREQEQDYGGLVILRHETDDGDTFFTLFGHLGRECLSRLRIGQQLRGGDTVGQLGATVENGGWDPHLHFQLMLDRVDLGDEFPGVAFPAERNLWTSLSPNPADLLRLDRQLAKQCDAELSPNTLQQRHAHISPALSTSYREPLTIVRGQMQFLFDDMGQRYLDAYNNVPHVGHCHPRVVAAGQQQMARLNTNTRYLNRLLSDYTQRLCDTLPETLSVCFLVNSASEANELALRLARTATGRKGVVVQDAAYHGHTTSLIDVSPYKHDGPGGEGPPAWVHRIPLPDRYRGLFRGADSGARYAAAASEILHAAMQSDHPPGALLTETCPSVAGQIMPPVDYLPLLYDAVRSIGGVTIADEVQTGFGRLGSCFWAFERYGVVPDMVVMGKPMGNGHPLAAVVTTREIAERFDNGMEFFSTFGGNTVSCAIGMAVLDVLHDEDLQRRAATTGAVIESGLQRLRDRHAIVGDVRGAGLFWGVELVLDPCTLTPAAPEATYIVNRLRERGVLIGTDGPLHNVLKIRPPMQFNSDDAKQLLDLLDETIGELSI